jgi:hypothetical protein
MPAINEPSRGDMPTAATEAIQRLTKHANPPRADTTIVDLSLRRAGTG